MTDTSKEFLAALSKGLRSGNAYMTNREQADFIEALAAERDSATAKCDAVMRHIPMDYLRRHDVSGAIGPTAALNLDKAMRDYSEDRWKLIEKLAKATERAEKAEAERDAAKYEWEGAAQCAKKALLELEQAEARVAALEAGLRKLIKHRDDYLAEFMPVDPDTGMHDGPAACEEYVSYLDDIIEMFPPLSAPATQPNKRGE